MATFFIIMLTFLLISGYIRLLYIDDEVFNDLGYIPIILIIIIGIYFIIDMNIDETRIVSKEEICPKIEEVITVTDGDTVKTTTYIYSFPKNQKQ